MRKDEKTQSDLSKKIQKVEVDNIDISNVGLEGYVQGFMKVMRQAMFLSPSIDVGPFSLFKYVVDDELVND